MIDMKKGARLGQHFLKSPWAARALARAANITSEDTVLEIGPGKGALTRELLSASKKVVAIEKDEALVEKLREKFAREIFTGALTIISGDIRDITPEKLGLASGKYIVAANIPYYITGEIIRQFLTAEIQPRAMALLVQKEVAQRIISKKESLLSLSVKVYGIPKIVAKVPRGNFTPAPNVDSAILLIGNISRQFFADPVRSDAYNGAGVNENLFFKVIRAGFKSKRKYLLNNLAHLFGKESATRAFASCGINMKARAEDVTLEAWKCLVLKLT